MIVGWVTFLPAIFHSYGQHAFSVSGSLVQVGFEGVTPHAFRGSRFCPAFAQNGLGIWALGDRSNERFWGFGRMTWSSAVGFAQLAPWAVEKAPAKAMPLNFASLQ